ncbi:riboflavin synthase [Bdellovibrionota bacterium FG-2]
MFTGIIQATAKILEIEKQPASQDAPGGAPHRSLKFWLDTGFSDISLGESIAVNGVCLTVCEIGNKPSLATFFASSETLEKTNLNSLTKSSTVNLERALPATDILGSPSRLSGHIVQGHVDGLGEFVAAQSSGEARSLKFHLPPRLLRYCIEKGSIAINGISLTLNTLNDPAQEIEIMIIPHTWEHTNLKNLKPADPVNIEVDVIAKYVERLCQPFTR